MKHRNILAVNDDGIGSEGISLRPGGLSRRPVGADPGPDAAVS